jgi:cell division protein FtsI/penicillin-binding protein 2
MKDMNDKASSVMIDSVLRLSLTTENSYNADAGIVLENTASSVVNLKLGSTIVALKSGDSMHLKNPTQLSILNPGGYDRSLVIEPDVFMKNCFVNGSRYYTYPLESKFIWARNFSETIAGAYTDEKSRKNSVYLSLDADISNTIFNKIHDALQTDTAYHEGAEYAITVADSEGRILAMTDYIKGLKRPDPNDKAAFNQVLFDEENLVSQQYLRKQIGNLNLLRMNPGPGSTFKPIIFSAVASQLNIDWSKFGTSGFTGKQGFFGGEKVAPYDFEVNHGTISKVSEYLKVSDNYYHSNVLLMGSYPKQDAQNLLRTQFSKSKLSSEFQWPYLYYNGNTYWLNDYKNWPGYAEGKADFGNDSSFINIGLSSNFGIYNRSKKGYYELFSRSYDSLLFKGSFQNSAFVLPEYGLFDQQATGINKRIPYDMFAYGFRQHVKGSSQVLVPPIKMVEAFGKLVSQNKNYSLTLNPADELHAYSPFYTDNATIPFNTYQALMQEQVFTGMRDALLQGTAAALGRRLTNGKPYFYYVKTGTTGDDRSENKSRLFVIVISLNDISDPDTDLRTNKFYTIYFTSQNGPNKQYEALQEEIVKYIQVTPGFLSHMQDVERTKLTKSK